MESVHAEPTLTLDEPELARLKARDPAAQARFFRQYRDRVEAICGRVLGGGRDAQEIAADVLGDFLFTYVDGVESPRAVTTYLKLMATRRSLRWVRAKDRSEEVDDEGPTVPIADASLAGDVDQGIWQKQMIPRLDGCLEHLTPKAREVLKLRFSTELTNECIGEIVGGSKQYIGRLIKESTEKLKSCLEASG
jgi:RNA polymerase sigma factor (sigma-70 family)